MMMKSTMKSTRKCILPHALGLSVAALMMIAAPQMARADEPYASDGHENEYPVSSSTSSFNDPSPGPSGARIAGGVLIGLGGVSLAGGAIATGAAVYSAAHGNGEGAGLVLVVVALPLLVGGTLMEVIGVPLYRSGAPKNQSNALYKPLAAPTTIFAGFGYGSASIKVTF